MLTSVWSPKSLVSERRWSVEHSRVCAALFFQMGAGRTHRVVRFNAGHSVSEGLGHLPDATIAPQKNEMPAEPARPRSVATRLAADAATLRATTLPKVERPRARAALSAMRPQRHALRARHPALARVADAHDAPLGGDCELGE
jgi:hypothetical protein